MVPLVGVWAKCGAQVGGGGHRSGRAVRAARDRQRVARERARADREPAPRPHPGLGAGVLRGIRGKQRDVRAAVADRPVGCDVTARTGSRRWRSGRPHRTGGGSTSYPAREHDVPADSRSYIWDSGSELLTEVLGQPSLRLPRPANLVPPALALRLLHKAGAGARFSVIPPLRVAGRSAAGLHMTQPIPRPPSGRSTSGGARQRAPADGRDLRSRLPYPALETQFFGVEAWRPQAQVLTPQRGPGTGFTVTSVSSLPGALSNLGFEALPPELAGRVRVRCRASST